jgi:hypothetical protein
MFTDLSVSPLWEINIGVGIGATARLNRPPDIQVNTWSPILLRMPHCD